MGYGDLSYTEVIISREAKLSRIYETEVWVNSISYGWLLSILFYRNTMDDTTKGGLTEF